MPKRRVAIIAAGLALAACQALPPAVSTALTGFGQDVLAAAAQNFAPQYAASVQNLFFAMAETATGMPFTQQADGSGEPGMQEEVYAEAAYDDDSYGNEGYVDAYGQQQYEQEPYETGYAEEPHDQVPYGPEAYADMGMPAAPYGVAGGIALEVALLSQQRKPDGQVALRPVRDGDVLHDGRGDPARGDKIKIFFAANCACHVYVIGVDATGYVARIFPDGNVHTTSRVAPDAKYLVPGGTTWWGLDDYRGTEQIYFIASRERRHDIEDLVAQLAGQRPSLPADYRPVREPAVVAMTRGLVQVQSAAPAAVPTEYGAEQQISPTLFQSTVADADLVITRWFRHE